MNDSQLNSGKKELYGRHKICTSAVAITEQNVLQEVNNALSYHVTNALEIDYLYWYRRGVQPILGRVKEVRPEICNKITNNISETVVTFKNGYFLSEPAFYVSRSDDEKITEKVQQLNEYLYTSGKNTVDNQVVDWFHTVGIGVLLVEPSRDGNGKKHPANVYCLDPRSAFVVYSLRPGNEPMFAVNYVVDGDRALYDVFTKDKVYRLSGGISGRRITDDAPIPTAAISIDAIESNVIGEIPIVEYLFNSHRMGSFECAIPLMDAYNVAMSNRLDGIEQAVQQLCVAYNCEFSDGVDANTIRSAGMIVLRSTSDNKADFKILESGLDNTATESTCTDLYSQIMERCGIPSTNRSGYSTSDNVGAVYMRNGFAVADTQARSTEDLFKLSNKRFDKVFLAVVKKKTGLDIDIDDFDLAFIRNDMNNLLVKTQACLNMKDLGFSPELALERSGLSSDPINDVAKSRKYIDAIWEPQSDEVLPTEGTGSDASFNSGAVPGANDDGNTESEKTAQGSRIDNAKDKKAQGHWVQGYWR